MYLKTSMGENSVVDTAVDEYGDDKIISRVLDCGFEL